MAQQFGRSERWEDQKTRDSGREPCPDRVIEDLGSAFSMGCIGGFLWHAGKGMMNSPRGDKLSGALLAGGARGAPLGTSFAVWGGVFGAYECTLQYIRRADDSYNNVASGFLTGGTLAARAGWKVAGKNAVIGGSLLAIMEGAFQLMNRQQVKTPREQHLMQLEQDKVQAERAKAKEDRAANGGNTSAMASWMPAWGSEQPGSTASPSQFGESTPQFGELGLVGEGGLVADPGAKEDKGDSSGGNKWWGGA